MKVLEVMRAVCPDGIASLFKLFLYPVPGFCYVQYVDSL